MSKRPGETVQEYALRRTYLLIKSDVPSKHIVALKEYIDGLSKEELTIYIKMAEALYDKKTIGIRSIKVTLNSIKLCVKLSKCGYKTFPYIKKIATKGWDTAGGTYSFSIPLLNKSIDNELCSFGPINKLVKEDAKLDVFYNAHTRSNEVDFE